MYNKYEVVHMTEKDLELSSAYDESLKKELEYQILYKILDKKYKSIDGIDSKDIISRNSTDGIANKLKKKLFFDVKEYAKKSDKEMFSAMKLYKYLFDDKINYGNKNILTVIENIRFKNSIDADDEHYNKVINDFRAVVPDHKEREETINWIHECWTHLIYNISPIVIEDSFWNTDSLNRTYIKLKQLFKNINSPAPTEENIFETFYNLLISTQITADIKSFDDITFNYEKDIPVEIKELVFTDLFSELCTFENFLSLIDIKNLNETSCKIWSLILYKSDLKPENILKFNDKKYKKAYNFTVEQAEQVRLFWLNHLKKDKLSVAEWCIIIRELLVIYYNETEYPNRTTGHTNSKLKLRTAIKNKISGLPYDILLERLTNRNILLFGKSTMFQLKKDVHDLIRTIERTIFTCRSIDDMIKMHSQLYFMTSIAFVSIFDYKTFFDTFTNSFNNFSFAVGDAFGKLLCTLQRDYAYRLKSNQKYMNYQAEIIPEIFSAKITDKDQFNSNIPQSEMAYQILTEKLKQEITRIKNYSFTKEYFLSDIITLPIFLGNKNRYYLYLRFRYYPTTNTIDIDFICADSKK